MILRLRLGEEEKEIEIVESRLPQTLPGEDYQVVLTAILPPRTSLEPPEEKAYRVFLKIVGKEEG